MSRFTLHNALKGFIAFIAALVLQAGAALACPHHQAAQPHNAQASHKPAEAKPGHGEAGAPARHQARLQTDEHGPLAVPGAKSASDCPKYMGQDCHCSANCGCAFAPAALASSRFGLPAPKSDTASIATAAGLARADHRPVRLAGLPYALKQGPPGGAHGSPYAAHRARTMRQLN